ncbi:hypothetical protein TorRG33x02_152050 [Trema orientale]|uniref:Uncharacterized protein n=1 Tax=Trema orientale TaxID=63057 RepID=A0A2P5ETY1_TREOI|nr:hypothetical protein TorRG33x02_152050 [Trema orientale]
MSPTCTSRAESCRILAPEYKDICNHLGLVRATTAIRVPDHFTPHIAEYMRCGTRDSVKAGVEFLTKIHYKTKGWHYSANAIFLILRFLSLLFLWTSRKWKLDARRPMPWL